MMRLRGNRRSCEAARVWAFACGFGRAGACAPMETSLTTSASRHAPGRRIAGAV
jgi:hypothetical protein